MADQISDAVFLDAILGQDVNARVAVETMVKTGMANYCRRGCAPAPTSTLEDQRRFVRHVILDIGYDSSEVVI